MNAKWLRNNFIMCPSCHLGHVFNRRKFRLKWPVLLLWSLSNTTYMVVYSVKWKEVAVGERIAQWICTPQVLGSRPG